MTIPNFQSKEHKEEFEDTFADKALQYVTLMNVVKELMYGSGHGNYANLPGTCLQVVKEITNTILYDTEYDFELAHPEYKQDSEVFIPYRSFKENVTEALKDALQTTDNETIPTTT